jgi:hypothetical protein
MRRPLTFIQLSSKCCLRQITRFSLFFGLLTAFSGCGIKTTVKTRVPLNIQQDKTVSFQELLEITRNYDKITSLSSNSIRVVLISGRWETGVLQKYHSAPGYILLKRPGSTRLVIQHPLTKTAVVDLLSVGDDFSVWIPSENKFFVGKNSAKELVFRASGNNPDFTIPIRGTHIFEAILPQSILPNTPEIRVALEEDKDDSRRFYILSFYREGTPPRIHVLRKLWIERTGLTIARQQVYFEDGKIESDIAYSNQSQQDGFPMPLKIHIDRPQDGYALDMEFGSWKVNSDLPDSAFILNPPPEAQIVRP